MSRRAYADLVEIGDFGAAQFGEKAADAYQDAFDHAFQRLAIYPHIGEAKSAFGNEIRCLVCNRHHILYRTSGDIVQIVRILHHSRDVSRHLPT